VLLSAARLKVQYTDKKENETFLIYKEIQMGSGAKPYMKKGFLLYEECANFPPYMRNPLVMTLHPIPLNFLIYEENFIFYFFSVMSSWDRIFAEQKR
jgi:hypothetical protein